MHPPLPSPPKRKLVKRKLKSRADYFKSQIEIEIVRKVTGKCGATGKCGKTGWTFGSMPNDVDESPALTFPPFASSPSPSSETHANVTQDARCVCFSNSKQPTLMGGPAVGRPQD